MGKTSLISQSAFDELCKCCQELTQKIKQLNNSRSVVLPFYDSTGFPMNTISGEIGLGAPGLGGEPPLPASSKAQ